MLLDDRKLRIMQAIIDDYISSAEPVGSRTIAKKHELGLSSATIRNEMADLEEMGFLEQPHTSAGRVPSDKGYRLYVDKLMQINELSQAEIENIRNAMDIKINELSQLIRNASVVMSRFTKYTTMAVTPHSKQTSLKAVQVVPIERGKALVIIVSDTNIIRNNLVRVDEQITPDALIQISNLLNEKLKGYTLEMLVSNELKYEFKRLISLPEDIVRPILDGIEDLIKAIDQPEVYLEGTTNILNFPEFREVEKAKEFLNILDEKKLILDILVNNLYNNNNDIVIQIGNENNIDGIKECSLVTTSYSIGNKVIGTIGIIGPTRMEYSKVVSSMNYIRNRINQEILKLLGDG